MKIILYMATTVNGYIARENNADDFLSPQNWTEFVSLAEQHGGFVIGRNTYEEVRGRDTHSYSDVNAARFVVSRDPDFTPRDEYTRVSSPTDAVSAAEERGLSTLVLTGGASLNRTFFEAGLVDEVYLNIEPYVLGRGIQIAEPGEFETELELRTVERVKGDLLQLRYRVA